MSHLRFDQVAARGYRVNPRELLDAMELIENTTFY